MHVVVGGDTFGNIVLQRIIEVTHHLEHFRPDVFEKGLVARVEDQLAQLQDERLRQVRPDFRLVERFYRVSVGYVVRPQGNIRMAVPMGNSAILGKLQKRNQLRAVDIGEKGGGVRVRRKPLVDGAGECAEGPAPGHALNRIQRSIPGEYGVGENRVGGV